MSKGLKIPPEVQDVMQKLRQAGFESYAVGGCVRDLLLGIGPRDWDVTTSAKPEEILGLFEDSFYENKFLTVTVKTGSEDPVLSEIEITTYRAEGKYTDKRHPDDVRFAKTLAEDLSRRDFTVNAMAMDLAGKIADIFGGREDLEKKIIRAVGEPAGRFEEDALRMVKAVRMVAQLGFTMEEKTAEAIKKLSGNVEFVSSERIRDELVKILLAPRAKEAVELLHNLGLLKHIMPELEEGLGIDQRGPHKYQVWEHSLLALDYAVRQNWSLQIRLSALLHDVGKPRTRERRNNIWTFYGHDVVGAKMTLVILARLCFPAREAETIARLVRWHLFSYHLRRDDQFMADMWAMGEDPREKDIEDAEEEMQETTDSAIRRLIQRVGADTIEDLVKVRICDRIATGVPKAVPYRLRHFQFRVEKIIREGEATNVKMLKVRGEDILQILKISPGPKVGYILDALLEEVLDDPARNNREYLLEQMTKLGKLSDEELQKLREQSREKVEGLERAREGEIKKKYHVK